jgi:hypothetical protein
MKKKKWRKMIVKKNEKEFLEYLMKYIPTFCRCDEGMTFNLTQLRVMVEDRINLLEEEK